MAMLNEYFSIYDSMIEKYGPNTAVLYACGSFYEVYQTSLKGNADKIAELLNITYANKKDRYFCGFGTAYVKKYLNVLLDHQFTVVIVDQLEDSATKEGSLVKRGITAIYSPSMLPLDHYDDKIMTDSDYLVHILIDEIQKKSEYIVSTVIFNNLTNQTFIEEIFVSDYNEYIERIKNIYRPREVVTIDIKDLKKNYDKLYVQNEYLGRIYVPRDTVSSVSPVEMLGLSMYPLSVMNLMSTIDFIREHNLTFLNNLERPCIIDTGDSLILELNTVDQLNVLDIPVKAVTAIGQRYLKRLLCSPFSNPKDILKRYSLINNITNTESIRKKLKSINDIAILHRKMSTDNFKYIDLYKLYNSYVTINDLFIDFNDTITEDIRSMVYKAIVEIEETFNTSLLAEGTDIFKNNTIIDELTRDTSNTEKKMLSIRQFYNDKMGNDCDFIKLCQTEQENHYLQTTKTRYNTLVSKLSDDQIKKLKPKFLNSVCKIFTEELTDLSIQLSEQQKILNDTVIKKYSEFIKNFYQMFNNCFDPLISYIEVLDHCVTSIYYRDLYGYVLPNIVEGPKSYINCKALRHPIIERLPHKEAYVANDVLLKDNGIILFGINSSGKSSLLRAVGLAVIMAQACLHVPSSFAEICPFKKIVSQVDLSDDIFLGKSSFINEMLGLKKILECSGKQTLILSDEMCKGTEYYSSISLVTSVLKKLIEDKTSFFFTSHLHQIVDQFEGTNGSNGIKVFHFKTGGSKDFSGKDSSRILEEGPGSKLYGLEVAKKIINNDNIINNAFSIRKELVDDFFVLKKSRYNAKKLIIECETCGSRSNLEVHHKVPQKEFKNTSNINGLLKNDLCNLSVLCHKCHLKITTECF